MPRPRGTTTCGGCHRRAPGQHAGCTCPTCGGPKHRQAERCVHCADRGHGRHAPSLDYTSGIGRGVRLVCLSCGRGRRVVLASMNVLRGPIVCGVCRGRVIAEPDEDVLLVQSLVRAA